MKDENEFIATLLDPKTQNKAFEQLLLRYQKPIYNHIRSIVLNHDDADDVVQNTFLKIYQNLHAFKGESKLFSWMYRIATNEALSLLQKKAKQNNVNSEAIQNKYLNALEADSYFEGDAIQLKLQKAIATLPEKQQLVFKMKYFQDINYEELSEILLTSVGALKASYHHAVKKIEEYLNQN